MHQEKQRKRPGKEEKTGKNISLGEKKKRTINVLPSMISGPRRGSRFPKFLGSCKKQGFQKTWEGENSTT